MLILTLDPISMNHVADTETAPFVIDGDGPHALKIYFENELNRAKYIDMPLQSAVGMRSLNSDNLQDPLPSTAIN